MNTRGPLDRPDSKPEAGPIDPRVRVFLADLNKDSSPFWELPQRKPQDILIGLQNQTRVDKSGVTTTERAISELVRLTSSVK